MDAKKGRKEQRDGASRRAKDGGRSALPGSYLSITVSLVQGQLEQLDHLAVEIRALCGKWITRSGILTAITNGTPPSRRLAQRRPAAATAIRAPTGAARRSAPRASSDGGERSASRPGGGPLLGHHQRA